MLRYNKEMPSASTIYRQNHPEYALKEKEQTRARIVNKYNNDPQYKELLKKARALAYYYKKKQEKENKNSNDDDVEYY